MRERDSYETAPTKSGWVLPEEWRDDADEDEAFAESLCRRRREAFAALEQLN